LKWAVNCVDREHTLCPTSGYRRRLGKLVSAIGGIVLGVAAELPQRRRPELADVDPIFSVTSSFYSFSVLPPAAGYSLKADGREGRREAPNGS